MSTHPLDKSNMRRVILDFPKQFQIGWEAAKDSLEKFSIPPAPYHHVLIGGMGGSALAGELLKSFLDLHAYSLKNDAALQIDIHRNYDLPAFVAHGGLLLASSYSGNTEETLSLYMQATKSEFPTIALATGGKLIEMAKSARLPYVELPDKTIQPRNSLGYQFAATAYILFRYNLIKDMSVNLFGLAETLRPETYEEQGKELAKKLKGKIPLIYTTQKYSPLGTNWKIRFNESSKTHAFWNVFPELDHNELVGFTCNPSKEFHVLILRDANDYPRILKRMDITANLIRNMGIEVDFVDIKNDTMLMELFSTIVLGDWVSYYLALEEGVDPTPVEIVEQLKRDLA